MKTEKCEMVFRGVVQLQVKYLIWFVNFCPHCFIHFTVILIQVESSLKVKPPGWFLLVLNFLQFTKHILLTLRSISPEEYYLIMSLSPARKHRKRKWEIAFVTDFEV